MNYLSHVIGFWILFIVSKASADQSWCDSYNIDYCDYREFVKLCPVYCKDRVVEPKWNQWTNWSGCSKDCGGVQTRTRDCNFAGATSPNECPLGDDKYSDYQTDSRVCNRVGAICNIAVHGGWADWGEWSACSVTCGKGTKRKSRTCTKPRPDNGGLPCLSLDGKTHLTVEEDSAECSETSCPVNGGWTGWSVWSTCSATCGDGKSHQQRCCTNPAPAHGGDGCEGISIRSRPCTTEKCPVDGKWGKWNSFGPCDEPCGFTGIRRRFRNCDDPAPANDGKPCDGNGQETAVCGRIPCPVHGGFSDWAAWSQCSDNCNGVQYRIRCCNSPAPLHNGKPCGNETGEVRPCKARATQCSIVPGVENQLVAAKEDLASDKEVDVLALVGKEFTVEFTFNLKSGEVADGKMINFKYNDSDILAVELVTVGSNTELKISTLNNGTLSDWTSSKAFSDEGNTYPVKIRQFLDVGELKREILIEGDQLDIQPVINPSISRDVKVILGETDGAAGVEIDAFKFFNNPAKVCPVKADVLYMMDTSISVQSNFDKEKEFTKQLVRAFPVATDNIHRGSVITFSSSADIKISFSEPADNNAFLTELDAITFDGQSSSSRVDLALYKAKEDVFEETAGDRADVQNLAILIFEGGIKTDVQGHGSPARIAKDMRDNGIDVFAVGIHQDDDSVTEESLKSITGEYRYIRAQSWDELANEEFIGRTLDIACRVLTDKKEVKFPSY